MSLSNPLSLKDLKETFFLPPITIWVIKCCGFTGLY